MAFSLRHIRHIRMVDLAGITAVACFLLLPTQSLAQSREGEGRDPIFQAERAEIEKRKTEARAALLKEQEKQEREAAAAKERLRRQQEEITNTLAATLQRYKLSKETQKTINRLEREAKDAHAQASREKDLASEKSRELAQRELELNAFDAKLKATNKALGRAYTQLDDANNKLDQAQEENSLRALGLEIWRAVLSVSLLGLLASNVFTYLNMRHDRKRAELQDTLTNLQIEEMKLKVEQLRSPHA